MLRKDQRKDLVIKLTTIFKDLELGEFEEINDVVTEARKQATIDIVMKRNGGLVNLFDDQIETLKSRGCPQAILEVFQNKKSKVIVKAVKMEIPEGNIPFVPVIPRTYMGIYGLMPMVRNGNNVGYTHLDPNDIIDNEEVPKGLYYVYDVEPGKATLGKSSKEAEKIIKKQNRLCHILDEDIATCVHTDVLSDHYLMSTGSCDRNGNEVPHICISDDEPVLSWYCDGDLHGRWGSASCRSRA
ncbi:hypothetical protein KKI23_02200 [Patescibacteria group bacterium]|nr:hypothetical protein [Patescibacteria group bacterium]